MAKKKHPPKTPLYPDIGTWIKAQPPKRQPKLRRLLAELTQLFHRQSRDDLLWWYGVGIRALAFFPTGDRQYGVGVIELLADQLRPGRERNDKTATIPLYRARQLAATFTYQEIRELGKKRNAAGHALRLHHVFALLAVEDAEERGELTEACLAGNWSVARLRQEIQNRSGRKQSAGGLSPKPPERPSPGVALRDISVLARRWMAFHRVWFGEAKAALRKIPVRDRDGAMLKELERAEDGLLEVAGAVKQGLQPLETLRGEVEKTIASPSRKGQRRER